MSVTPTLDAIPGAVDAGYGESASGRKRAIQLED
jgi:hypothetical protein